MIRNKGFVPPEADKSDPMRGIDRGTLQLVWSEIRRRKLA